MSSLPNYMPCIIPYPSSVQHHYSDLPLNQLYLVKWVSYKDFGEALGIVTLTKRQYPSGILAWMPCDWYQDTTTITYSSSNQGFGNYIIRPAGKLDVFFYDNNQ